MRQANPEGIAGARRLMLVLLLCTAVLSLAEGRRWWAALLAMGAVGAFWFGGRRRQ